jgi:membrane-associated phospholipid phosphatase
MSRDLRVKIGIQAVTLVCATAVVVTQHMVFPLSDLWQPLGLVACLSAVMMVYHHRNVLKFVPCLTALIHLVVFCSGFVVLMYAIGATGRPLVDAQLARADQSLGFQVPAFMNWVGAHPGLNSFLNHAYDTILPQTILVIALLGFCGDQRALEKFILQFMVCALATVFLFYLFPAKGPFAWYGFAPTTGQAHTLAHLESLRSGLRKTATWRGSEGLISFPSFHATWAMLLAMAFRHRRRLFVLSLFLNVAVIVSTLTTGWHYLSDVAGGILVCVLALMALHPLEKWIYASLEGGSTDAATL